MMDDTLQITFHGLEHSDAIERRIREKAATLERFCQHIISLRVTVDAPHVKHHKGTLYSVRIDLRLPNNELAVSRTHRHDHAHEDVYAAIRDAFDALTRQLEDHLRCQRGAVKRHEQPNHGRVARLFPYEGYGFIEAADGTDVYFHRNAVAGSFDALELGTPVRLVIDDDESPRGPQATSVVPLGTAHAASEAPPS